MVNRILVPCPQCHRTLKVRAEYFGNEVICKHCDHTFKPPELIVVPCPQCEASGTVAVGDLGQWVRCGQCLRAFPAEAAEGTTLTATASTDAFPPLAGLDMGEVLAQGESLREELQDALNDHVTLNVELEEARRRALRASTLEDELATLRSELESLRVDSEGWRRRSEDAPLVEAEPRETPEESGRLREAIDAAQARAERSESELPTLRAERDRLAAALAETQGVLDEARRGWDAERAGAAQSSDAEFQDRLQAELAAAEARAEAARLELQEEHARLLAASHGHRDEAFAERDRLAADHRDVLGGVEAHREAERAEARAAADRELTDLRAEFDGILAEMTTRADADRRALEARLEDIAKQSEHDKEAAAAESKRLARELDGLREQHDAARKDLEDRLSASAALRESAEAEARQRDEEIEALKRERDAAARESAGLLAAAETRRDAAEAEAGRLLDELQSLRGERESAGLEHAGRVAAADAARLDAEGRLEQSVGELTRVRDEALAERDRLAESLRTEQAARAEDLRRSAHALQEEQGRWEAERDALVAKAARVQADLDGALAQREAITRQAHAEASGALQETAVTLRREADSLRAERAELQARLAAQADQGKAGQAALARAEATRAQLERRFTEAQADLRSATYHADSLEAEVREARDRLDSYGVPRAKADWGMQAATLAPGVPDTSAADRRKAEDLSKQLAQSRQEVERLRAMFNNMGIRID